MNLMLKSVCEHKIKGFANLLQLKGKSRVLYLAHELVRRIRCNLAIQQTRECVSSNCQSFPHVGFCEIWVSLFNTCTHTTTNSRSPTAVHP